MGRRLLVFFLLSLGSSWLLFEPVGVSAQTTGEILDAHEECVTDPHGQACICVSVPAVGDTWEGSSPPALVTVDQFKQMCSLSYYRENLRRFWYFSVAVGAGLMMVSMGWAGVSYMQSASSGEDLSRSRTRIFRVLIGIVVLASAFVIWETLSGFLLTNIPAWTGYAGNFDIRR